MTRTWIFFSLFVLLLVTPAEFSDVVGHEPVQVTAGDDVILPCHLDPPFDVSDLTVEWTRNGLIVHLYTDRADNYDHQDEQFLGRTSLFPDELVKGNISLKLTNVTEDDSGLYICYVPRLNSQVKRGNVLLRVNPQKDPGGGDKKTQDDNEPTKDDQTGLIAGSVLGSVGLIAALVIIYVLNKKTGYIKSSDVVGHDVQVTAGGDVILSCHLEPPFDVSDLTVEWKRNDVIVHLYRDRTDKYDEQDKQFRGRTSLFHHELVKGNISLKLTKVTEDDSGLYICYVRRLNSQVKRGNILLTVNHLVQVTAGGDVILSCHLHPPFDVTDLTVVWERNESIVHLYRDRADKYDAQDEQFRGRTSLFPDELVKGDISLKLTNVTEDDSGLYICSVPRLNSQVKKRNINLTVNSQKDPERRRNKQKDDKKREEQDAEEPIPMNPPAPSP